MKDFFKELFEYTHHYNKILIGAFHENSGKVSEKSIQLMSHILNVHHIWNNRIIAAPSQFAIWEIQPGEKYSDIDNENFETSNKIIDSFTLDQTIHYVNTKGQTFDNTVRDILFQIINHTTYHRGQIAMEFRQCSIEPLVTEFIVYKR